MENAANEADHIVILCNSDSSPDKKGRYLRVLQEQRATGMLITPTQNDSICASKASLESRSMLSRVGSGSDQGFPSIHLRVLKLKGLRHQRPQ